MIFLLDKLLLFFFCLLNLFGLGSTPAGVTALLTAACVTALSAYLENKRIKAGLCAGYFVLSFFFPNFLIFLPLPVYDSLRTGIFSLRLLWVLPVLYHIPSVSPFSLAFCAVTCLAGLYLGKKTGDYRRLLDRFHVSQDNTREESLNLNRKNQELLDKQDYEIQVATLSERNRIAREIHDNVGHLLTRSLYQVSALEVIYKDNPDLIRQLDSMKATLDDAMSNVRNSVHGLHDESLDLKISLSTLIEKFSFCPVTLHFEAGDLPKDLTYCFISIVKEALSNIARHSDATSAAVEVWEHPGLYQLIIKDNGTPMKTGGSGGIGLTNMKERVDSFHGVFRIEQADGFRIFVSIPKKSIL